uniref:RNA-directed DNA polymerase n=1 Tax=Anopheles atroparvus TaxID=41427 RepID=A0AAG5DIK1_ANOAO
MPFGLKNAPATFQRAMNSVLSDLIGRVCFVYLDDIIVIGKDLNSHLKNLSVVLQRLACFNLKIQLDKCEFLRRETEFLGHTITPEGIKPNPDKIRKILEWSLPKTKKEIKQFLGLAGYYRKFIKDYSKITRPLSSCLKKEAKLDVAKEEYLKSFENLKAILSSDQVLAFPDFEEPFILTTDASNHALGAVLSQIQSGQEKPIAFGSRTLNETEQRYSTTEKEALAIIWAVEKYKPYLYGRKFTLVTDHKPLVFIKSCSKNAKILRWRLELENYEFEIKYKEGKANVVADALSRKPMDEILVNVNTRQSIYPNPSTSRKSGSTSRTIHSAKISGDYYIHHTERPINYFKNQIVFQYGEANSETQETPFPLFKRTVITRQEFQEHDIHEILLRIHNGKQTAIHAPIELLSLIQQVYRKNFDRKGHFVLTASKVEDVTIEHRQDAIVRKEHERAHRGIREVEQQIRRAYFFPNLLNKIRKLNNSCKICYEHKYERKPYNIKITPRPIESAPFHRIHIDIFGMDKNHYLTIICSFSKHLQAIKIDSRNTTDIQAALSQYFSNFGIPRTIVCDHEKSFKSIQLSDFLSNLDINTEFASSSESNGQIEKTHSTLIELYNTNKHKFPEINSQTTFPLIIAMYNDTIHSATGYTPNEIIFNKTNLTNPVDKNQTANALFKKVYKNLKKAYEFMSRNNSKKENPPKVDINEPVYIKRGIRKKLDSRFIRYDCKAENYKTLTTNKNIKRHKQKLKRIRKT